MKTSEFLELVQNNKDADKISKGTEYKVYDKYGVYMCTVGVIRTALSYYNIIKLPEDILTGEYTFKEIKD